MKKLIIVALSFLICLSFFGCSADNTTDNENTTANYESITDSDGKVAVAVTDKNNELVTNEKGDYVTELVQAVTNENKELVTNEVGQLIVERENGEQLAVGEPTATTAPQTTVANNSDTADEKTSAAAGKTTTATTKKTTTTKKQDTTAAQTTTTKKQTTTAKQTTTTKKQTTSTTAATSKGDITVKITIKDGDKTVLNSYAVTAKKGTAVSEFLKMACNENAIDVVVKKSDFGGLTVNKIGDTEGNWCFSLNGAKQKYNFSEQKLNNNDSIVVSL